jgi:hypothetical protein
VSNRKLTPQDYIHKSIIEEVLGWGDVTLNCELTLENASEIYNNPEEYFVGTDYPSDAIYEAYQDYRSSGEECNILPKSYSRHYEVGYVVKEIDGKWVGWNYWYGGGKHAEPEDIDWIGNAEFVKVQSEEVVTVVKRTFMREG